MNSQKKNKVLLFIALLLIAFPSYAESLVAHDQQGNYIRITDDPCPTAIGWLKMKKAEFRYEGKLFEACWILARDTVLIFDEAGDLSAVPVQLFEKENKT